MTPSEGFPAEDSWPQVDLEESLSPVYCDVWAASTTLSWWTTYGVFIVRRNDGDDSLTGHE